MARRLRSVGCAAALLLLGALACGDTQLRPVAWRVGTDAQALHFGTAYVGAASERTLVLSNDSRAALVLHLASDAPAFEAPAEVRLAPGAQHAVALRFVPAAPGAAAAELVVTGGDETLRVALQGEGLAPGACAPATACSSERFDPAGGRCERSVAPDGSACAEACLSGATCQRGECVGLAAACDDGDACTRDACGARGCVHLPVALPEAPADRPCQVATCDPQRGVVWQDREDGSACGEATCGSARVCMAGACVTRAQPLGVCGRGCGGQELRCDGEACVAQDGALAPVWRHEAQPGMVLNVLEVLDPEGNVYWVERNIFPAPSRCELVSADLAGRVRFRVKLDDPDCAAASSTAYVAIDGAHLVVATWNGIEWRRRTDGGVTWKPDVGARLSAQLGTDVPPTWLLPRGMVHSPTGDVFVLIDTGRGGYRGPLLLLRFNLARREVVMTHQLPDREYWVVGLSADEQGRLFSFAEGFPPWPTPVTARFRPDGTPDAFAAPPALARENWNGRMWSEDRGWSADTGVELLRLDEKAYDVVGSGDRAFGYSHSYGLWSRDLRTGRLEWWLRMPTSSPVLLHTADGGVLMSTGQVLYSEEMDSVEGGLVWVAADGRVLQQRNFCEPELLGHFFLHRGRVIGAARRLTAERNWVESLVAFDVPGRPDVSSVGWVSRAGDQQGSRAPR